MKHNANNCDEHAVHNNCASTITLSLLTDPSVFVCSSECGLTVCVCAVMCHVLWIIIMNAVPVDKIPNSDIFDQIPWHWTTLYVAALNRAPEETGVKLY